MPICVASQCFSLAYKLAFISYILGHKTKPKKMHLYINAPKCTYTYDTHTHTHTLIAEREGVREKLKFKFIKTYCISQRTPPLKLLRVMRRPSYSVDSPDAPSAMPQHRPTAAGRRPGQPARAARLRPSQHGATHRHTDTPTPLHTHRSHCLRFRAHATHSSRSPLSPPLSSARNTLIAISRQCSAPTPPLKASRRLAYSTPFPSRAAPIPPLPHTHIPRIDGRAQARQCLHRLDVASICSRVQGRPSLRRARRVGGSEARGEGHPTTEQDTHAGLAGWSRDLPASPAYPRPLPCPPQRLPRAFRPGGSSSSGAARRAPRHPDPPLYSHSVRAVDGAVAASGAGSDGQGVPCGA